MIPLLLGKARALLVVVSWVRHEKRPKRAPDVTEVRPVPQPWDRVVGIYPVVQPSSPGRD